jgi:hypothetical protein
MGMEGVEIPDEVLQILGGGPALCLATSDGAGHPEITRGMGAIIDQPGCSITVLAPTEQAGRTLINLRARPHASLFLCSIVDYRAAQMKGDVLSVRPSTRSDRVVQERYLRDFVTACGVMGYSRELTERLVFWPSVAIEIKARELWVGTPGPQAGRRWC